MSLLREAFQADLLEALYLFTMTTGIFFVAWTLSAALNFTIELWQDCHKKT